MEKELKFKIVLIGDSGVGKTSILKWYTDGIFTPTTNFSVGADLCVKSLKIGNSNVEVRHSIWLTYLQIFYNCLQYTRQTLLQFIVVCVLIW